MLDNILYDWVTVVEKPYLNMHQQNYFTDQLLLNFKNK